MLDIRLFRENPDLVRQSQIRRGEDPGVVDQVLALDTRRRELQTQIDTARAERNTTSAQIPKLKDAAEKQTRIQAMRVLGEQIAGWDGELRTLEDTGGSRPGSTSRPDRTGKWPRRWASPTSSAGSRSPARAFTCWWGRGPRWSAL
jgi:hypothetical protein